MENGKEQPPLSYEDIEKQKAELQALVNAGKLTRESALAIAEKLGLISTPVIERSASLSNTKQLFNFSVYKWSKGRTVQRLILQFDFDSKTLSSIQHGTRTKKVGFTEIKSYQSEDGLRLTIQFESQSEYELDADTQEDKNKMCRLLGAIKRVADIEAENAEPYTPSEYEISPSSSLYPPSESQSDDVTTDKWGNGAGVQFAQQAAQPTVEDEIEAALTSDCLAPSILSSPPIKEDMVEKKGHSAKILLWAKRWLRVCDGEMMYYKPDDIENALNIIPLNPNVTEVKKIGSSGFSVTLRGSNKVFSFRSLATYGKTALENREEWYQAIVNGSYKRRLSAAGLRRGTVTAKELMAPKTKQPTTAALGIVRRLTLRRQSSPNGDQSGSSPPEDVQLRQHSESPPQARRGDRRSKTISTFGKRPRLSFRKRTPSPEAPPAVEEPPPVAPPRTKRKTKQRSGSSFYDPDDITRRITEPRDFPKLDLQNKETGDLLLMLRPQFNELVPIIQNFTIGSSEVDQMMMRIDSIICALEGKYTERTGTPLRGMSSPEATSPKSVEENGKHLSAVIETTVSPTSSHHSSRLTSPALPTNPEGLTSPDPVNRVMSPVSSEAESEVKVRSGGSSKSSSRMSVRELAMLSPEQLQEALSDSGSVISVSKLSRNSSQNASQHATPITSPVHSPEPPVPTAGGPPPPPPPPGIPGAPPPPPLFPGVPGAPPPPPLFSGSGPPPPPPPPGAFSLPSLLPPKQVPTPSVKMRKIHWTPLKQQTVIESGWMGWSKNDLTDKIDLKSLEELFGVDKDKNQKITPAMVRKVEMKTLLDTTRSRNIEIFLPTFPFPLVELADTLNKQLDVLTEESDLGLDHVIALKRYQPTEEEREMYKKFTGDKNNLQHGDIFLVKLCEIPLLSTRLDLLFTIREFPSNFEGFQPTLDLAWQATRELKHSKEFADVLCYVLAVGNYLNAGSRQGGAYGFRLSILPKLVESYGQNKKTSLHHYIIQQIHCRQPALLDMHKKMEAVAKSSDISITGILAELEVMQKELDKIERYANKVVEQAKMTKPTADKLLADVKGFVKHYRDELAGLDKKGQEMADNYRELLKLFGEPLNTDSEDFFSQVAKFVAHFKRVHLELYPPPPPSPKPNHVERKELKLNGPAREEVDHVPATLLTQSVPVIKEPGQSSPGKVQPPQTRPMSQLVPAAGPRIPTRGRSTIHRNLQPKEGYLEKLTKDGKKWQKRFFELESCNLHYYEGKGQKYGDTIKMYCVPVKISPDDRRVLVLETDKRVWSLRADSDKTASEWLSALKLHSQGTSR